MPIETSTQKERNGLLDSANLYYPDLVNLVGIGYTDLERLLHSTGNRAYTLMVHSEKGFSGKFNARKEPLAFFEPIGSQLGMRLGDLSTPLGGTVYFVGRKGGDRSFTARYWEGDQAKLKENASNLYDAFLSRVQLILCRTEENRIVVADIGTNILHFRTLE